MDRPYPAALAGAVGAALIAGLLMAVLDAALTARGAPGGVSFLALLPLTLGLYALPALLLGVAAGLVAGAMRASFGAGALTALGQRLRHDRALDREITAGLLAGAVALALLAGLVAVVSLKLVAGVERKSVGALLTGALIAGAVPLLAVVSLPVYRAARVPARLVPALGPLPACAVLVLVALAGGALALTWFVTHRLDWRALNLGGYLMGPGYIALFAIVALLAYGPLGGLRRRVPRGGVVVVLGSALALALVPLTVRAHPPAELATAISEHSAGARLLVAAARRLVDGDGDGFSPLLGGPDCDDSRADVNPNAAEIPGNGIDDNCLGGDRATGPAGGAGAAGAAAAPAVPRTAPVADSVIIIAVDTLRADRLGAAGYRRDGKSLTPRLDRLAAESAYFRRVYAQAPNTPRSFPSIFTSRYPSQVHVDKEFQNYSNPLDDNLTLFEVLKAGGLSTHGVASHFFFDRAPGMRQGFDEFDNEGALDIAGSNHDIASPRIVPRVEAKLASLAGQKGRFALFVHLFEPHSTYMEHEGLPISEHGSAALAQKYDYEIAYVDGFVGRILDAIDKDRLRDRAMVVLLSDHGEAFGVHRAYGQAMYFHGQTLYEELLRVPILIRMPGVAPSVIEEPAALLDVAPTIVDALGVAVPDSMQGRSLLGPMTGHALPPRPIFAQLLPAPAWDHKWMAMVAPDGAHKLIYRISDRAFELYDLARDPTEVHDQHDADPKRAAALQEELTRWLEVDLAR